MGTAMVPRGDDGRRRCARCATAGSSRCRSMRVRRCATAARARDDVGASDVKREDREPTAGGARRRRSRRSSSRRPSSRPRCSSPPGFASGSSVTGRHRRGFARARWSRRQPWVRYLGRLRDDEPHARVNVQVDHISAPNGPDSVPLGAIAAQVFHAPDRRSAETSQKREEDAAALTAPKPPRVRAKRVRRAELRHRRRRSIPTTSRPPPRPRASGRGARASRDARAIERSECAATEPEWRSDAASPDAKWTDAECTDSEPRAERTGDPHRFSESPGGQVIAPIPSLAQGVPSSAPAQNGSMPLPRAPHAKADIAG